MYICLCNAITDRQIVEAAHGGARTDEDLAHGLGIGITCGRCRSCATILSGAALYALLMLMMPKPGEMVEEFR